MRTPLIAAVCLFAGCVGEIDGGGGGGGDDVADTCGDGVTGAGETCDDGNTTSGDGCSSACGTETALTPRVTAALDKQTVTMDLGKTEIVTLNLSSVDGFTGDVTITPTLVDGTNAPLPAAITVQGPASLTLSAGGTATGMYTITVPSNASGVALTGSLNIGLSADAQTLTSALSIQNIYTFEIVAGTGAQDPIHPGTGKTVALKRGTKLRMVNNDTVDHITHGNGGASGIPHEGQTVGVDGKPGATYEVNTVAIPPGTGKTFGCHTHGAATYASITLE